ncbi:sigma 54-interacting transcriptional regulator [Desulfococcaceae bacterium HSG9]|nr:sigma 54-interacting transcriptional regulator [Desulfococcaceae bacterium HSG9]
MNDSDEKRTFSILIVDDEPINIQLLANILNKKKYEVEFAISGEMALKWTASKPFDLILLDIMMPEMDGFEVCRRLKADPDTRSIPVIFLTAIKANKKIIQGFATGAVDYITRPFDSQIVLARVKLHLELKCHRDHLEDLVAGQILDLKKSNRHLRSTLNALENEITVRKNTESQLRASETKLTSIIDAFQGFIYICDHTGYRINFMNQALIDHIGEDRIGENCYKAIFDFDAPCSSCDFGNVFKGETVEMEIENPQNRHWYHIIHTPLFDADGVVHQRQAILIDTTERKLAEKALMAKEERLRRENLLLRMSMKERYRFGDIIGKSKPMQNVYKTILKAASTDASIILYGESGTGKELVAQAIHNYSERNDREMVIVNCGAIPEKLAESEFFGHKKGAFTGAVSDKKGFLESADGSTLFLDEVGEIPLSLQVKLLRAIESGGFSSVGGRILKRPDFRIIAATNKRLRDLMKGGLMRKDFFYRIHIIPITLPPLRKRREDIPLLVDYFIQKYDTDQHRSVDVKTMDALLKYDWPGNVRELQNTLHRYVTLNKIDFMGAESAILDSESGIAGINMDIENQALRDVLQSVEKKLIIDALDRNWWHKNKAAKMLGIDPKTLYRKIKQYRLK